MREELRQIFQTGVKNKHGNDVKRLPSIAFCRKGLVPAELAGVQTAGLRLDWALVVSPGSG